VSEALAAASSSQIANLVVHVDWNQATIDVEACCREGREPGQYVQWDPVELAHLHELNVILVPDGHDFDQVLRAQSLALEAPNHQPTCVVYRTQKGWRYGIGGRRSHGAGHPFGSDGYHEALAPFEEAFGVAFPRLTLDPSDDERLEEAYWETLLVVRRALERDGDTAARAAAMVEAAAGKLARRRRRPRPDAPELGRFTGAAARAGEVPAELALDPGTRTTLRGQLGRCLGYINRLTGGGVMGAAADLLDSTSVSLLAEGVGEGFYRHEANPRGRLVSAGGICEDAAGGLMSGLSSFGAHIGVSSSYAAFIAPLEHIAARCHAIGQEAKRRVVDEPAHPFVIVMGHASIKTGPDGPTHADPQALQLYQENFVPGACISLTPWEPAEMWPLLAAALRARPAIVAAFVTRPEEVVPDRASLGIAAASEAGLGIYAARTAEPGSQGYAGTVIVQGSGAAREFFLGVLPELDARGLVLNVLYVASVELFDSLPADVRRSILPPRLAAEAMGITDFTLPTLYRFVTSERGRSASLHPFRAGRHLGSGPAEHVLEEAGLDAVSQLAAILAYAGLSP
jgi:transketolase